MSSSTITAVVCSYWPNRSPNVKRIIADLLNGTVVPDTILVLNNNENARGNFDHLTALDDRVGIIEGSINHECRGKFAAALFHIANFYLLLDDDTSVGPTTVETLRNRGRRGFVTGYWGVQLNGRSFMSGGIVQPRLVAGEVVVDAFHGRVMFMAHDALVRMFAVEEWIRLGDYQDKWSTAGDDIIAGLVNHSLIIPLNGDSAFVDLDESGQAMQYMEGYFRERDEFTGDLLDVLASHQIPQW